MPQQRVAVRSYSTWVTIFPKQMFFLRCDSLCGAVRCQFHSNRVTSGTTKICGVNYNVEMWVLLEGQAQFASFWANNTPFASFSDLNSICTGFNTPSSDMTTSSEMLATSERSFCPLSKLWKKSLQSEISGRGRERFLYKIELRAKPKSYRVCMREPHASVTCGYRL